MVLNPSLLKSIDDHDGEFDYTIVAMMKNIDILDSTYKDMLDAKYFEICMCKTALEGEKGESIDGNLEWDGDLEVKISNNLQRDGFFFLRALCKL